MTTTAIFSNEELDRTRRPLAEASLLPPRVYTAQAIHDLEVEKVFARNWLPVCRVSDVAENGSYFTRVVMGEPVIITRDAAGIIHALSNVCRHRNRVVADGAGACPSGRLVCPYHAWTYGLDGQLLAAPEMDRTENYDKSRIHLPRLGCDIWQGFVFVNFDADAPKLSTKLGTLDAVLAPYKLDEMEKIDLARFDVDWNWKVSLENFTEAYHQPTIHRSFDPYVPGKLAVYEDVDGPYNLFWLRPVDGEPFPTARGPIDGLPDDYLRKVAIVNVFPLLHLLVDPGMALWLDWEITGPESHAMIWSVLVPPGRVPAADKDAFLADVLKLQNQIFDEDVGACSGVALGARSRFAGQGRLSWMEKSVHQFQSWLADEYARP